MKSNGLLILKYQDDFADNMTSLAYGKILENKTERRCYFENITKYRTIFEEEMKDFNIDYDFVSSARVEEITSRAFYLNRFFINEAKISNELKMKKNSKNRILDLKHFSISDIPLISSDIKEMFKFKDVSFIVNYDILEEINQKNSIGLYINKNDIKNSSIDFDYINRALKRLNKYIKRPKLFIFSSENIEQGIDFDIDMQTCVLHDKREEFLFLKETKHKILYNSEHSYSKGFWSAVLADKDRNINIYSKDIKTTYKNRNWIAV